SIDAFAWLLNGSAQVVGRKRKYYAYCDRISTHGPSNAGSWVLAIEGDTGPASTCARPRLAGREGDQRAGRSARARSSETVTKRSPLARRRAMISGRASVVFAGHVWRIMMSPAPAWLHTSTM